MQPRPTVNSRLRAAASSMRWPIAGLALLFCLIGAASMTQGIYANVRLSEDSVVDLTLDRCILRIRYRHGLDTRFQSQAFLRYELYRPDRSGKPRFSSYFLIRYGPWTRPYESGGTLFLPICWCLLGLGIIAWMCFRARKRLPRPGQCPGCLHPLAGAAVCPECGSGVLERR